MSATKYRLEFVDQARKLAVMGVTNAQLADFFNVSERTIDSWIADKLEFSEAVKVGKAEADKRVERSLYERALGYSHPAQKIMQYEGHPVVVDYVEHYPPDVVACIFWLKNRCPERWRDRHDVEVASTVKHDHEIIERLRRGRERLRLLGMQDASNATRAVDDRNRRE